MALVLGGLVRGLPAQATTDLPVGDPAYVDLDLLIAGGWVRDVVASARPFALASIARMVREAERRGARRQGDRVAQALDRLCRRFCAETVPQGRAALTASGVTATATNAERRAMRAGARRGTQVIDADFAPLLQRNQGRVLFDGATVAAEGGGRFASRWAAGEVTARGYAGAERDGTPARGQLLTGYLRAQAGPFALDAGRSTVVQGFGPFGGALASTNARGWDHVRGHTAHPLRLPWVLRHLGLFDGSVSAATLGNNRDNRGQVLVAFRGAARPVTPLELGVSYLNTQGGAGSPVASWRARRIDLLQPWKYGGAFDISDKVIGADLRVAAPAMRSALYANFSTTDDRGDFTQPARGWREDAIWIIGAEAFALGPAGRWDVRVESRQVGPIPHTHHQFTSGLTLDRRTIGDFLGPNARSLVLRLDHTGREERWRVQVEWERHSSDDFEVGPPPNSPDPWAWEWKRVSDNPEEYRNRLTVEHLRFRGWRGHETTLTAGYEFVQGFAFGPGRKRHHLLAQVALRAVR